MKLKVKIIPIKLEHSSIIMNPDDAAELGLIVGDRLKVTYGRRYCIADVQIATGLIEKGELGVCTTVGPCEVELPEGAEVEVTPVAKPSSVDYIRKKLEGEKLSKEELYAIIRDIVVNMLNEVELSAFVMANYLRDVDLDEVEWMTRAMIDTGETLTFEKGIVVDKHSVGGVPGDKTSLLVVPIIAAGGLLIPKTASRAITSASGTADTMEVLANVSLSVDEIKEITERVGGVIAWGGATNIAPADDKIIRVEYPLAIIPKPHLLSSVMAKKGALGAKHVVIDIPVGEGSRIATSEDGRGLANDFSELGRRLGLNVSCVLTYGSQPVGRAIGPALEAREALSALESAKGPKTLIEKSIGIAGVLFEMAGKATRGADYARQILESGKALEKFREIIEAQGGNPDVKSDDIAVGDRTYTVTSNIDGAISRLDNVMIKKVARAAGAPKDKGAGIMLHKKGGQHVKVGDPLFTIYAEKEWKLDRAVELAMREPPVVVSGMILERWPSYKII
ncbi:AMP phosphorylase [Archaeoglobus veneficus]|uniref:AMP phosphorylase n=1 Tax=Archaeoglobus veneficus (strain DSM 11195 / SNP6) TaxID=693661 RepID=F2KNP9_ARCVS|nr:AMP phosphorylase [Archaeoglobus veneficus]AEA46277.1 thymidine phosphorylase [Archaeoglobus veneficus SNP6]